MTLHESFCWQPIGRMARQRSLGKRPPHRPWLVFLKMLNEKNEMSVCEGSILSDRIVLTAAHCVCNAVSCKVGFVWNF